MATYEDSLEKSNLAIEGPGGARRANADGDAHNDLDGLVDQHGFAEQRLFFKLRNIISPTGQFPPLLVGSCRFASKRFPLLSDKHVETVSRRSMLPGATSC